MVDVVLLTLISGELHVALHKRLNEKEPYFNAWALPGGEVHTQEDQDAMDTARRVLKQKANVVSPYLEQLETFTGVARDPRGWSASIAYYALVPEHVAPAASDVLIWSKVDDVRSLPFDHLDILKAAATRLRSKTSYSALPLYLMPPVFTLTELRSVYEQVLKGKLEPRGFARRMEELDILEETGESKSEGGRPARLYRAKHDRGAAQLGPSLVTR